MFFSVFVLYLNICTFVFAFDSHSVAAHITGRILVDYQEGRDSQEILDTVTNTDNDDVLSKIELTKVPLTDHTHTPCTPVYYLKQILEEVKT